MFPFLCSQYFFLILQCLHLLILPKDFIQKYFVICLLNAIKKSKSLIHSKIHNPIVDIVLYFGISGGFCLWEFDLKFYLPQMSEPLSIFSLMNMSVQARSQTVQQWKCHYHRVMINLEGNSVNLRIPGAESLTLLCGQDVLRSRIFTQLDKCDSCLSHSTEKEGGKERMARECTPKRFFVYSAAPESLYFI